MKNTILKILFHSERWVTAKPVPYFPDWDTVQDGSRLFQLHTDANTNRFGAVLNQPQLDGFVRPILYISRATRPNEVNWSPLELEGRVITWAIKRLRRGPSNAFGDSCSTCPLTFIHGP